jgi:hypothetical protein
MTRKVLFFMTLLLVLASLACGISGDEALPVATATIVATPTLAPTATPDPAATPLGAVASPETGAAGGSETEPAETAAASGQSDPEATVESGSDNGQSEGQPGDDPGQAAAACPAPGQNLLLNSSFEGDYKPFGAFAELNHAPNWFPWWQDGENNLRPEFKPAEVSIAPNRVHSGARAQQYFKSFGQFKSGMYQSVLNVTPGSRLQFSIFGQAWSCEKNDQCPGGTSVNPANMLMRVGLDPTGDVSWSADTVVWSPYFNPLDQWQLACVEAVADSEIVTVFVWASPDGPRQNQDVYWDDGNLVVLP